jgi:D-alanine-D-alanine ligase
MNKNLKIVVVCGGISSEREVSLRSGAAVYKGLVNYGYKNVELFDLKRDNLSELISKAPDIVYLALHGEGGEDGCIQGALELAGIPYTGSGVETSAVCMNKVLTKQVMQSFGIPTAKFVVFNANEGRDIADIAQTIVNKIGLPAVLKSPCQGSSIGVVIVKEESKLEDAIKEVYSYGNVLLAEEYLVGTEVTLPILGNDTLTVLPDIEITTENEFYDYGAKYTNGMCRHIIPSRLPESVRAEVAEIGERLYKILNCRGLSRIDFIVDEKKGPMVIEVNTLPGMTEMSLFPDSAAYVGISFEELVAKVLELGLE